MTRNSLDALNRSQGLPRSRDGRMVRLQGSSKQVVTFRR